MVLQGDKGETRIGWLIWEWVGWQGIKREYGEGQLKVKVMWKSTWKTITVEASKIYTHMKGF